MKKIISLLIAMLLVTGSYAAKKTDAVHQDVKEAITVAHEDVVGTLSTVYQDGKDAISTIYGDGKELAGNLYPEVKSAIIDIAKAIGVAAEHVYTVLVKKFVVDAIVQLLPFLLGLLLIGIAWFKMNNYFKTHEKIEWHILYPCILLIIGIIALFCVDYSVMVMGLVNPEYGALNYILEYSKEMLK